MGCIGFDALLRLMHPTSDFDGVRSPLLSTDADFVDFASNHYKSPIDLDINRTDRLTNYLLLPKAKAKNEYHTSGTRRC